MKPPQGRIEIGDRVRVPGGGRGLVVRERLIQSSGAWKYVVAREGGGEVEHFDWELGKAEAAGDEGRVP